MRVLVTGADGFIGSHLCEALARRGHDVLGLCLYNRDLSFGWLDGCDARISLVHGDVRDATHMQHLVQEHEPAVVYHLAALIDVADSYRRPYDHVATNVLGTQNVLEAVRRTGAHLVHVSSSEVYGTAQAEMMAEDHPINPQSPYAASKVGADALVRAYRDSFGITTTTLRPFNTYGPRQSTRAVLASICRQAADRKRPFIVVGNTSAQRDWVYVDDTVSAMVAALSMKTTDSGPFNISTGKVNAVSTALEVVRELGCEKPVKVEADLLRPATSEVSRLCGDATKFKDVSGWEEQVDLKEGLRRTLSWWKEQ